MIRILIVEDEKPISELMRLSLTKAGYSCHCVYDGAQAADILEKEIFDLVLLDVMLPKYSGFELMEYIRPSGTPVIFITARNSVDDRVKGLRMGAEDYIVKPFEVIELRRLRDRPALHAGAPRRRGHRPYQDRVGSDAALRAKPRRGALPRHDI